MSGASTVKPRFMSHEHVALVNQLLEGQLLEECSGLDRDLHVHYEIADDPEGIRTWTVTVGPSGMRLALDQHVDDPVLLVRENYFDAAAAAAATRVGGNHDYDPVHVMNDAEGFARVAAVVEASRAIATVDVDFPSR